MVSDMASRKGVLLAGLMAAMFVFTFVDFVRRFVDESKWVLLALDFMVIVIYIIYFAWVRSGRIRLRMGMPMTALSVSLVLLFAWTAIRLATSVDQALTVSLAGFRSYWLAVPMIAIGAYVAERFDSADYRLAYSLTLIFSVVAILFSLIQLRMDLGGIPDDIQKIMSPMGHSLHSYGQEVHELSSSFFASSKRYGKYLLFCYLVLWAIGRSHRKSSMVIFVLFSIGLYSAGSREALWIFLLFHGIYLLTAAPKRARNVILAGLGAVAILIVSVAGNPDRVHQADHSQRTTFLFALGESLTDRILIMLPVSNIRTDNPDIVAGEGLGSYGAEALLDPAAAAKVGGLEEKYFFAHDFFRSSISFADAGLAKITIELGVVGMVLYLAVLTCMVVIALSAMYGRQRTSLSFAAGYWILAWVFFFLKAHVTISDLMLSVFLYGAVGYAAMSRCGAGRSSENQANVLDDTGPGDVKQNAPLPV